MTTQLNQLQSSLERVARGFEDAPRRLTPYFSYRPHPKSEAKAQPAVQPKLTELPLPLHYALMAFIVDALMIVAGFFLLNSLRPVVLSASLPSAAVLQILAIAWMAVFTVHILYSVRQYSNLRREILKILWLAPQAQLLSMGLLYVLDWQLSLVALFQHSLLTVALLIGWRVLFVSYKHFQNSRRARLHRCVLVIGSRERVPQVISLLNQVSEEYLEIVGTISNDYDNENKHPVSDEFENELRDLMAERQVDDVVMAFNRKSDSVASEMLKLMRALPVQVYVLPAYMSASISPQTVNRMDDLVLVNMTESILRRTDLFLKRALDIAASLIAIILTSPIMAAVMIAIKLESPGPFLFVQERVGQDGELFKIYKFRSMRVGADKELDKVAEYDDSGRITNHKRESDPRITRIGRIIRKTSLDELPQLFNVLKGDMSLVGPRPELVRLVSEYEPWQQQRFKVKQGITGWWQVNGRSENPCHMSTHQDIEYIRQYSFLLDVQILIMTIPALLKGKGAF
jgi:exopolysaccharide biosynthesis polyprenyl glycosylphosphotransferase